MTSVDQSCPKWRALMTRIVASSVKAIEIVAAAIASSVRVAMTNPFTQAGSMRDEPLGVADLDFDAGWGMGQRGGHSWSSGGFLFGIFDATVVDPDEGFDQAFANFRDFAERQPALVELAIVETLVDEVAAEPLDPRGRRLREGPAGALDGVGHHQDGRFFGLRFRARVAERPFEDRRPVGVGPAPLGGFVEEVLHQRRPVVLFDQVDDRLGEVVLPPRSTPSLTWPMMIRVLIAGARLAWRLVAPAWFSTK